MDLFRLVVDVEGNVIAKDKVALGDVSPAMQAPFLGPFNGGSGSAEVPIGEGKHAILSWEGTPEGTARGDFGVDAGRRRFQQRRGLGRCYCRAGRWSWTWSLSEVGLGSSGRFKFSVHVLLFVWLIAHAG